MVSGRPEELIQEKRTVRDIAFFVGKRMQGSIIFGGNAERSTDTLILVISNSCNADIESTTNPNVSGMPELSRHIGPPYQTRNT
eukprot:11526040-Heterocapsa_arctica.AAC.1